MQHDRHFHGLRSWVAAALAFAALPSRAAAPPPWEGPAFSADPGALVSAAAALPARRGGRDVLLDERRVRLDERGAATSVHRVVYRVVDADAAADLEAGWAPWAQDRPRIRARVVDPGGAIHTLDPADLEEREVPSSGRRLLAGALPAVEPGAVVEVEITVRDRAPQGGELLRFALAGPEPIRRLRVDLTAPAGLPLRTRVRSAPAAVAQEVRGDERRLHLERRDVPAAPAAEPGRPREAAPQPELVVGWGGSWPALAARAGAAFTEGLAAADLRTAARAAAGNARTREELVRRLTAWMHQSARCTGVALGDAPLRPAAPRDTLLRREGDGKDLALLLLALLGAQGIDARPALVRAAWDEVLPDVPALGMFDHVLVRVEGTPPVWIDPCDPAAPPGRLPAALEERLALPLGPAVRGVTRTPGSAADQNRVRIERELTLPRLGPATVIESRELSGAPAQAERALRLGLAPDARDALDQRHALEALGAEDVTWVSVEGGDDPDALLRIRMEARGTQAAVTGDEGARVPVPADPVLELLGPALARGADRPRRADLLLPYAFRAELVYRVVPPDGLRAAALPPPMSERFGPVRLRSESSTEPGGAALVRWFLDCDGRRVRAADAAALARRLGALRREGPAIQVERVSAALFRSGRIAPALAELRAVARRHPEDVVAAGQVAVGLLRMGFTAAAEAEIRRVLQLQPGTGWGHRVLGLVLEHDELGRYRGPGFRRAAALAAYRQARALDPGNVAARVQLADLLAHGDGPQAQEQRAAALSEYEALARDLGDRSQDGVRLELLYEVGRLRDAVALARELPAGEGRDTVLLAALAAQGDGAAALAEAERLGSARSQALHGAARLLLRGRRYDLAAQLARAAAEAAPGQRALREEAEMLSRLEPWERTRDRGDEGEALVRRAVHAAVTAAQPAQAVGALLARRLPEREADLVRRSLVAPFASMRRSPADEGGAPDLVADLLLSGLTLERDGDRATVERIRVRLAPGQASPSLTVFLVPEGKTVKILATDGAWPVLVAEAERCAAGGARGAARRWLSFAAEILGEPGAEGSPGAVLAALTPAAVDPGLPELRRAAAALRAFDDPEGATIPPLVAAREQAASAAERRALGFALAAAYRGAGRWPELLGIAADLLREDPRSTAASALRALALARLGRTEELRAAAADALAALRDDSTRATTLAGAQLAAGDLPGSLATYRRIIDASRATPGVFNDAAWLSLFAGAPGLEALEWARRGAAGPSAGHAALNTLAAVQGALGQAAEAREALLRSLEAAGRRPPEPADWLAQGLVAEACGLAGEAREAYARVKPEPDDPSAPYLLARRRLEALDAPRPAPSPPAAPAEVAPPSSAPPAPPAPPARKDPRTPRPARRPPRASPA